MRKAWILSAVFPVIFAVNIGAKADSHLEKINDLLVKTAERLTDLENSNTSLLEQNRALQDRIGELENTQGAGQVEIKSIRSGAIVAFDLAKGCPGGWNEFAPAAGRFVIGVDGDKFKLPYEKGVPKYQKEGEYEHKLILNELPTHTHGAGSYGTVSNGNHTHRAPPEKPPFGSGTGTVEGGGNDGGLVSVGLETSGNHNHSVNGTSGGAGSGIPHNNVPPYIALYLCKKK